MKRLIVLVAVLGLIVAGAAIALANDGDSPAVVFQTPNANDDVDEVAPPGSDEHPTLLSDVLDELVDENVISEEQADAIRDRIAEKRADGGLGIPHGFRHHFRLPDGFVPPEGFEIPDGFDLRGPIELPDEIRDELDNLLESLQGELDLPFGGRMFRFPGGTLRDFLDDGELSQDELDQIEAQLRDMAAELQERFELHHSTDAAESSVDA